MDGTSKYLEARRENALPDPFDEVLPGVIYGRPDWVFSPGYWEALVARQVSDTSLFRKPSCLIEEVCFCLLGGYGVKAEVNCAAFALLQQNDVFVGSWNAEEIEELLRTPLKIGLKTVRYRFPKQRGRRISEAVNRLKHETVPIETSDGLRRYLLTFTGIGPKTASWITRNWLDSDEVAIIDIHVERAGRAMGIFEDAHRLPRDYFEMERSFLALAASLNVRASLLDVAIWSEMRKAGMPLDRSSFFEEHTDGQRRWRWKHGNNVQEASAL